MPHRLGVVWGWDGVGVGWCGGGMVWGWDGVGVVWCGDGVVWGWGGVGCVVSHNAYSNHSRWVFHLNISNLACNMISVTVQ